MSGSCFFSPNIRNVKREFIIKSGDKVIEPMRTFETNLKLNTLSTNLIDLVNKKEIRTKIIKGLYINLKEDNNDMSIDIKLTKTNTYKEFKTTGIRDSIKIVKGYEIYN